MFLHHLAHWVPFMPDCMYISVIPGKAIIDFKWFTSSMRESKLPSCQDLSSCFYIFWVSNTLNILWYFYDIYEGCQVHAKWMPSRGGTWQILAARPLWWPATAPIFGSPEKRSETKRHNAKRSCWCWPCWKSIEQHVGQLGNMSKTKIVCNKMEMIWDQASTRSWIFTEYSGIFWFYPASPSTLCALRIIEI